ncbi:MAG: nuclear transport factor 2 family protein [Candidatus Acidiferrales bacterium]
MKRLPMAAIAVILACAPFAQAQTKAASDDAVIEQIKQLDHKWLDAERHLDVAYCQKFFADSYVLVLANGQYMTKAQWLGVLGGPDHPTITVLEPTDIQVHLHKNVAIITDHVTLKGHDSKGGSMDGEFNVFRVLLKQNGAWHAGGVVMNAIAAKQ